MQKLPPREHRHGETGEFQEERDMRENGGSDEWQAVGELEKEPGN